MRAKSFIKTSVNVTETKIDEGAWKKISHAKMQRALGRTFEPKQKPRFTYFMRIFFSQT